MPKIRFRLQVRHIIRPRSGPSRKYKLFVSFFFLRIENRKSRVGDYCATGKHRVIKKKLRYTILNTRRNNMLCMYMCMKYKCSLTVKV